MLHAHDRDSICRRNPAQSVSFSSASRTEPTDHLIVSIREFASRQQEARLQGTDRVRPPRAGAGSQDVAPKMRLVVRYDYQDIAEDVDECSTLRAQHSNMPLTQGGVEGHVNLNRHPGRIQTRAYQRWSLSPIGGWEDVNRSKRQLASREVSQQVEEVRRLIVKEAQGQVLVPGR